MSISSALAVGLIRFYQRYISPHKGFSCAYHQMTGKSSCSSYALKMVQRNGVMSLFTALPKQFSRCSSAYQTYLQQTDKRQKPQKKPKSERCGDCVDMTECVPTRACKDLSDFGHCDVCDCSFDIGLKRTFLYKLKKIAYRYKVKNS
ncbi:membrane protein insertion efficiency factor YidD [Budvicia aquatica]|uniref:Domain of uncharacterized function DUF37 n=1 Tax=Budvicia aquatica TaxID=82979 RepID=A0A2C6CSW8_9GAMM|nr:membrane protein insertion efficiency factor YidD [Budvicia aquatica]PHI29759.1 membrane protein insertion efficiency factor YidD [Budvicia aquatica]VFS48220.1 Domain of uncharacterised function DUF37 [Budvicia aquatica]